MAWARHQSDPACAGCHQLMDPIGFGFENFDELGRFRVVESGFPIDARGQLIGAGDLTDDCAVEAAHQRFFARDSDIGELLVALAVTARFRSRNGLPVVAAPLPAAVLPGAIGSLAERRRLLLELALSETKWLVQVAPEGDRMVLERYAAALRDLEAKLSQL